MHLAKQNKNLHLQRKALQIASLQNQICEGKDIKLNEDKIQMIMSSLSLEDLFLVLDYIERKQLVKHI